MEIDNALKQERKVSHKITEEVFLLIEELEHKLVSYQSKLNKRKIYCKDALETSKNELIKDLQSLLQAIAGQKEIDIPVEVLTLGKDVIASGAWISRAYIRYLKSFLNLDASPKKYTRSRENIVKAIANNTLFDHLNLAPEQIFQAVFQEICHEHDNFDYITPLNIPHIETTIVIVSGVLNELYKTAAFERGVQYLKERYGIKYFVARVHGRQGSTYNARLMEEQLIDYIKQNPDEKLWILAHSKGGIDALHFLKRNPQFAEDNIVGLSTIASPIQGSPHADSRVVKVLSYLNKLEHTKIYKTIDNGRDVLLKNVPRFLSENFQKRWFQKNHKYLPNNLFYSSLALESEWYKAHVWMLLAKLIFRSDKPNDGVVDTDRAHFPNHFPSINLGTITGHHLVGTRSSTFNQEALLESYIITLHYLGVLK